MVFVVPKFEMIFQDFHHASCPRSPICSSVCRAGFAILVFAAAVPLDRVAVPQADSHEQERSIRARPFQAVDTGHGPAHRKDHRGPDHAHARHADQLRRAHPGSVEPSCAKRPRTGSSNTCTSASYESIREGETIAQPLKETKLVDDMVVNMVDVGEETGDLDSMLSKIADVYDEEVNVLVESLLSMLEPIMILVLGTIIGTIVIALFLPMIKLIEGLSGSTKQ